MTKYIFNFQHATRKDAQLLFDWRNDPLTCKNSLKKNSVKKEDHIQWLTKSLESPKRELYIVTLNDIAVGTVRLDYVDESSWELSWTIAPDSRGKGYGKEMIKQATTLSNKNLIATILKENIPSVKIAEYAGFVLEQDQNKDILRFKLTKLEMERT